MSRSDLRVTYHAFTVSRVLHPVEGQTKRTQSQNALAEICGMYKWYVGQRFWQQKKTKLIPEQHRKYILIEFGPQGDYYISSKLRKLSKETRDA